MFDERDYNSSYSESTENGDDEREDRKIHDQTTSQKMMDFLNNNKSNLSNSPNHAANINNSINTSNMNNMNNKYRRRVIDRTLFLRWILRLKYNIFIF